MADVTGVTGSRVVLHVGTMKSGTTFLQRLLFAQKSQLAAAGVLVPGAAPSSQPNAVYDVLKPRAKHPLWRELIDEVRAHPGTSVISVEMLGPATDRTAQRVLAPLADMDVRIVVTARDLNRTIVSMWQETIQNGRSWTWQEYVTAARDAAPGTEPGVRDKQTAAGTFWRQQHLLRMLSDWSARVGPDRVTLVTVPAPGAGADLLAERFAQAAGIPLDPHLPVPSANSSLGLASILVLRELNETLHSRGFEGPDGKSVRKYALAKNALAPLASDEPRLGLAVEDWVRAQTEVTVRGISDLGVKVVGELADLVPVDVPGIGVDEVSLEHRLRATSVALAEVMSRHPTLREDRVAREERAARRAARTAH